MATVSESTYLCFSSLKEQCKSIIQKLTYQNFVYDVLLRKIDNIVADSSLQGESLTNFKSHMSNYKSVLNAMRDANQYDINDCYSTIAFLESGKAFGENVLDGNFLFTKKREAESDRSSYSRDANSAYYQFRYGDPDYAEYNFNRYQCFSGMAEYADQQVKLYEGKIARLQLIEDQTCNLFKNGNFLRQYVSTGLSLLKQDYKYVYGHIVYQGTANTSWKDDYLSAKKKTDQEIIDEFYDGLPENIKLYVSKDDFECTDDGLVVCKKSFAEIFADANIEDTSLIENNDSDVATYYDDQYLFGVKGDDGKYTYGAICMREYENDKSTGKADGDNSGVAISFVELDINKFDSALGLGPDWKNTDEGQRIMKEFTDNFDNVTNPDRNQKYSEVLQKYFSRLESKGSYLIADIFIKKIAQTADSNNEIKLPVKFSTNNTRIVDRLKELNEESGRTIYDEEKGCLIISNPDELTEYEKLAILAAYTGDISENMFAAEVKFHSDACADWRSILPKIGGLDWYGSAIKADMQIGEEKESGYYDEYYDPNNKMVTDQAKVHGEQ